MNVQTAEPSLEYYVGKLQPQYESDGHARIARMLDQYGIPFFYKQPVLIFQNGGRSVVHPDFTLPTYNNLVIDYNPHNSRSARVSDNSDAYTANNITTLILRQDDLAGHHWQQRLYDRMEKIYHGPLNRGDNQQH